MLRPNSRSKSRRIPARLLSVESLELRRVFATEVTAGLFGPPTPAYPMHVDSVEKSETHLAFQSDNAKRIELDSEGIGFFFDYGKQSVDLPTNISLGGGNLELRVSGDVVFSGSPSLQDDQIEFRLSGKAGVHGTGIIDVLRSGRSVYIVTVSLDNDGVHTPCERLSLRSMETWDQLAEGERSALLSSGGGVIGSSGSSGSSGGTTKLNIRSTGNDSAAEPHLVYAPAPTDTTASFAIDRTDWSGGSVTLKLDGVAKYGVDYSIDLGYDAYPMSWSPADKALTIWLYGGSTPYEIIVNPLQDNAEPGLKDAQKDVDAASENIAIGWFQPQSYQTGSAGLSITDLKEGVDLAANPSTTSELGPKSTNGILQYGEYHLKPADPAYVFKDGVTINWEIKYPDAENKSNLAKLGSDYTVSDEAPLLDFTLSAPQALMISNARPVGGDNDFVMTVIGVDDDELEGTENVQTRVFVPALIPAGDSTDDSLARTGFKNVEITEEYVDARTEKDEKAGCSCSCTTCSDGNATTLSYDDGVAKVSAADGMVLVTTAGQNGVNPVTYVGLPLPSGKAIPTTITAQLQVVEKRTDSAGNSLGLGRKLVAQNAIVSPVVTLEVPTTAKPGDVLWFSLQADLSKQVESWNRNSTTKSKGANGINAKIIPLELLANAVFAPTVVTADQKFSGWVGRTTHVVRDESRSSIAPGIGGNASISGVDRMIRNTEMMLPDAPTSGGQSGGKVKFENGSMLVRANGGVSWFTNSAGQSPETQDTLAGNVITDGAGYAKTFNTEGDLTEVKDPAGNKTTYAYVASGTNRGAVSSITDDRGQQTTFTYYTDASGNSGVRITTVNSAAAGFNRMRDVLWRPITINGGSLKVTYDDPDGTGSRKARQDIFNYNNVGALVSIQTGEIGNPTHTTSISYDVTYLSSGGWLIPQSGSRRVATITYPNGSSTTLDDFREKNSLIDSLYGGSTILTSDPRALRAVPPGSSNPLPNYAVVTNRRNSTAEPQRSVMQLDHRGRVIRSWDPEQVFQMGLAFAALDSVFFAKLQSNLVRSDEYSRNPTSRDASGRITGKDYGEVLTYTSPQQYVGGPRETTTWTYQNGNPVTQQKPLQNLESFTWNDTFDVLTRAVDATGNQVRQVVGSNGLVTSVIQERQGGRPKWQNPVRPVDVNNDGYVSAIDALTVINFINTTAGGPVSVLGGSPPPFYDVTGDDYISNIDALYVIDALNTGTNGNNPTVFPPVIIAQTDYEYAAIAGLPTDLVSKVTTKSGRSSGDQIKAYSYYNTPTDMSKHAKLYRITETDSSYTEFTYDGRGNVASIRDTAGRVTKMWYDNRDRLIAKMSPDPDGTGPLLPVLERFDYDVFDNVIGTEIVNSWVDSSNLLRVTGLKTSYTYDAGNRITAEITQNPGIQWYFTDAMAQVNTAPGPSSAITTAQLEAYAAANSVIINTPTSLVAYQGKVTTYSYFSNGNSVSVTESNAGSDPRISIVTMDRLDRVVKSVTPAPVTATASVLGEQLEGGGYVTRYTYDNVDNLTSVTDALNRTTSYSYDTLNRVTSLTEPGASGTAVQQTTFSYTAATEGWKVTATNPLGEFVTTQYDQIGRTLSVTGDTPKQTISYWLDGLVKSVTNELGQTVDLNYDNRGRLTSNAVPAPTVGGTRPTTTYTYGTGNDALVDSVTDPLGRITRYYYDAGGRLSQLVQPDPDGTGPGISPNTSYQRDGLGAVTRTIDALGHPQTVKTRDAWFRTLKMTDEAGTETSVQYDVFGNQTSVTDGLQNTTTYSYNKLNQLAAETQTSYGSRNYYYDAVGNLRRKTDRNGRDTSYTFDNRNRITSESWSGTSEQITYSYDASDRTTAINDSHLNSPDFQFVYDKRGQLQNERQFNELLGMGIAFDRDYSALGSETKLSANLGATLVGGNISGGVWDFTNNYSYDGMNRLTSNMQTSSSGGNAVAPKLATFAYDAASQLTDVRRYASTVVDTASLKVHSRFGYDLTGRLTSITHGKTEIAAGQTWNGTSTPPASLGSTGVLAAYSLTYDVNNRVATFSSWRDASITTYAYDYTNQLTGASSSTIALMTVPFALPAPETFNYDVNGNRKSTSGASQSATGTQNRLQSDGTFNYVYDNEGNLTKRTAITSGAVTEYVWDHRNRLTSVISRNSAVGPKTKQVDYFYDAFNQRTGERIAAQFDAAGNALSWNRYEVFVWADGQEVLRYVDSDGSTTLQPMRLANRYLWGAAVDQLLADEQYADGTGPIAVAPASTTAGNTLWALTDHLGSVRDLVDNNAIIREHTVYNSFGKVTYEVDYSTTGQIVAAGTTASVVDTIFGYTGRDFDPATGLQYNRARWYDPSTGRWINQDPIGFAAGDENLYRYVGNQSIRFNDPSGEIIPLLVLGAAAGANYWIWGNNAKALDDIVNDRPLNYENTPYTGTYWKGAACSTAVGGGLAVATPYVATALPAWATTTGAVGLSGYGVYSNGSGAIQSYNDGNYFSAGFQTVNVGLAGYGGVQVIRPQLGMSQVMPYNRPAEFRRFIDQGYWRNQSRYLTEAYPQTQMGHHYIPRRWFTDGFGRYLPQGMRYNMQESPYNLMKPLGISRGRFYERHALGDPFCRGARMPGGSGWSRDNFMQFPPGRGDAGHSMSQWLNSPLYAMPDQTQGVAIIILDSSQQIVLNQFEVWE